MLYPPQTSQDVSVCMTAPLEYTHRRDRGCLSFKTCCSEGEIQDVLTEMCNLSMLTGLDWISDGERDITDRHGVTVGMHKMFKWPYRKESQCPFRLRVFQTSVHGSVSYRSQSWQFDIQYTSLRPHVTHVDTDTGECLQLSRIYSLRFGCHIHCNWELTDLHWCPIKETTYLFV